MLKLLERIEKSLNIFLKSLKSIIFTLFQEKGEKGC
jgi:hypothetical protein